ncbi:hypothetical protein FHS11_001282 [Mucilaginibacter gotjawali]|uniref:Uncharacterized protein n=1 Tax=Mucilaginibacter gotjawali TaxID=1550579 RepID=A0A839SA39_9SPHI|nr:hypothetical protein [Mucilaginibacter gotjawali]
MITFFKRLLLMCPIVFFLHLFIWVKHHRHPAVQFKYLPLFEFCRFARLCT